MTRLDDRVEVYRRQDGKWDWRRKDPQGRILSSSASQGYENFADALDMSRSLNLELPTSAFMDVSGHAASHHTLTQETQ